MTVRDFAARLGVSDRAVSKWEAGGEEYVPRPDSQAMLDTMYLHKLTEEDRQRFDDFLADNPGETTEAAGDKAAREWPQYNGALGENGLDEAAPAVVAGQTGITPYTVDVSGDWWASWQTFRDGAEKIATQQVECKQSGGLVQVATVTHGLSAEEGGYHWSGELRLWDNDILMGWYAAVEGSVRSKGTMYFTLHPHGLHMSGRWVGLGYDDRIMTGWGSMAKSREAAEAVIERLSHSHGEISVQ